MPDKIPYFYQQSPEIIALQVTIFLLLAYFSIRAAYSASQNGNVMERRNGLRRFARDNETNIKKLRIASVIISAIIYTIIAGALMMQGFGIFMIPVYLLAALVNLPIIAGRVVLPLVPWERYMQMRYVIGSTFGLIITVLVFVLADLFILTQVLMMAAH